MTETIEQKALALVNEACRSDFKDLGVTYRNNILDALFLSIEQHEAFRREVSEAVEAIAKAWGTADPAWGYLRRFIIAKPDPLHECLEEALARTGEDLTEHTERLRAALAARGLEIVKKEPSQ